LIHESQHQHLARRGVLHDGGNQAVELSKIQIHPGLLAAKKKPAGRLLRQRVYESFCAFGYSNLRRHGLPP
jgi:hypothetical protein